MRLPAPKSVRDRLRATVQWLPISLLSTETVVEVRLVTDHGAVDVTSNNAVAALRPLTVRLGLDRQLRETIQSEDIRLEFVDRDLRRVLGRLQLRYVRDWIAGGAELGLFEVTGGTHYCAGWPRRAWDTFMYERAARGVPREHQLMPPDAVERLMIFSLCPRPVFFVGVDDGVNSNLFPMDLVGPMIPEHFTLALRTTSMSVETIKNARRLALADVPGAACQIAYQLGAHHKKQTIDFGALPFRVLRSSLFSLPVPEIAVRAREIEIFDSQVVGSHTLFIGRIRSEQVLSTAARLFHTSGIHQRFRARCDREFDEALAPTGR